MSDGKRVMTLQQSWYVDRLRSVYSNLVDVNAVCDMVDAAYDRPPCTCGDVDIGGGYVKRSSCAALVHDVAFGGPK